MTILDAVNQLLTAIGQAPINSLDLQNPEIASAVRTIDNVRLEVLGEAWNFNSEAGYTLTPDSITNQIAVPPGTLALSVNQEDSRYQIRAIQRDGFLYNLDTHSFIWPANTAVSMDVVWDVAFEDLPQVFATYVTQRAARVFAGRAIGSDLMVRFNTMDESILRAACLAYETTTGRYNVFQTEKNKATGTFYRAFYPLIR